MMLVLDNVTVLGVYPVHEERVVWWHWIYGGFWSR
jgi:hypothetical protein